MPLRIGAASTNLYIERGADWCGQGKNNTFFEGCGMSACPYGINFWWFLRRVGEVMPATTGVWLGAIV